MLQLKVFPTDLGLTVTEFIFFWRITTQSRRVLWHVPRSYLTLVLGCFSYLSWNSKPLPNISAKKKTNSDSHISVGVAEAQLDGLSAGLTWGPSGSPSGDNKGQHFKWVPSNVAVIPARLGPLSGGNLSFPSLGFSSGVFKVWGRIHISL